MRVTLLLNRDLHACVALNLLLPALMRHETSIWLSETVARPHLIPHALTTLAAAERTIPTTVVWPLADRVADSGDCLGSFERCAARLGTVARTLDEPNSTEGLATLRDARPDVIVSIRYSRILGAAAIAIPRFGVLNLHSGQLPKYRGVVATFRALLLGDPEIGCTLHRIVDAEIDTGPIVGIATRRVEGQAVLFDAIQSVYPSGRAMIADALDRLECGKPLAITVAGAGGAYYTWPTDADVAEFLSRGHQVVELSSYARLLARFVPSSKQT